jgi:L-2-hydroxyglutarate oxidase
VRVRLGARVISVTPEGPAFRLETARGTVRATNLVNCAGLHSDRVAAMCGLRPSVRIVPFRGEYYDLRPEARALVRGLIYPVPDPRFPFLGVHFTRRVDGTVEAGPNAVLALARHGYAWGDIDPAECASMAGCRALWRMGARYWRTGLAEAARSASKRAFARALARLVPAIEPGDLRGRRAGVRAQALTRDGRLVDDFVIQTGERMVHVLNAPSPAATASLAIGEEIAAAALCVCARGGTGGPPRAGIPPRNREKALIPASL